MRQYPNLSELLAHETNNPNPRQAARQIENVTASKNPNAETLVLFKNKETWQIVPVGPQEPLRNTAQAARSKVGSQYPVAYCVRK